MPDHPPVTIAFEGLDESDAVQSAALRHARALERYCGRILGCTVVISRPHHHGRRGSLFSVRIFVALRDAFLATRRQLEDHVRVMRGDVKRHASRTAGSGAP
jgi:hypothetical protein